MKKCVVQSATIQPKKSVQLSINHFSIDPLLQICCGRILYEVDDSKECCEDNYIDLRKRSNDVCCGATFHEYQNDHQCCSGKYLKVIGSLRHFEKYMIIKSSGERSRSLLS